MLAKFSRDSCAYSTVNAFARTTVQQELPTTAGSYVIRPSERGWR
jgi:hypothetical protein